MFVTDIIRDELESVTLRNMALSPEMKVIITLRFLARGKIQLCSGDDLGLSQPTVTQFQ